jgi:hypothetical protein
MHVQPAVVLHKRLIACLMAGDPVAHVAAELRVARRGAIELVAEGAEETVAVADGGGGVQAQRAQLLRQQRGVLHRVREELRGVSTPIARPRGVLTRALLDRVVRGRTAHHTSISL